MKKNKKIIYEFNNKKCIFNIADDCVADSILTEKDIICKECKVIMK